MKGENVSSAVLLASERPEVMADETGRKRDGLRAFKRGLATINECRSRWLRFRDLNLLICADRGWCLWPPPWSISLLDRASKGRSARR